MKSLYQPSQASGRLFVLAVSIFASVFLRFFYKTLELFQQCGFSFSSPLRDGCNSIVTMNSFRPATFMVLSQARIYNPIGLYRGRLCVLPASIFASVFLRFFYYIFGTFPTVWYFIFDGCDYIATLNRLNLATFNVIYIYLMFASKGLLNPSHFFTNGIISRILVVKRRRYNTVCINRQI